MLRQLSSSSDNGLNMVIYPLVWIMLRQFLSSSVNGQSMIIHP